ncbi:MAG: hypothetical protein K2K98_02260 [Muribaculaceae bacterium]|nr:hypothetical protein [Muribaculaceae bacterium]
MKTKRYSLPVQVQEERIIENFEILNFSLTESEIAEISTLENGKSLFNWW